MIHGRIVYLVTVAILTMYLIVQIYIQDRESAPHKTRQRECSTDPASLITLTDIADMALPIQLGMCDHSSGFINSQ